MENPLNLKSLNHISMVCRSLEKSLDFYQNVLGFFPIRRPRSLDFNGAWLFSYYGIGIHLLQAENPDAMPKISLEINPKDNHISFQCQCMRTAEKELKEMKIDYVKGKVEENGIKVDQIFFHDPDGFMIEICNCDNLPVIPILAELSSDASNSNIRSCGPRPGPGPLTNFSHIQHYPLPTADADTTWQHAVVASNKAGRRYPTICMIYTTTIGFFIYFCCIYRD